MPDTKLAYTRTLESPEDFPHLGFSRSWEDPMDFPTYEPDEAVVRRDMQCLHDETRDYINNELIPSVVTNAEMGRKLAERPNTNFLINPCFVGGGTPGKFPVNQRGKTSYSDPGYGIDGWSAVLAGGSVTITNDGLNVTAPWLTQYLEDPAQYNGVPVTLSLIVKGAVRLFANVDRSRDYGMKECNSDDFTLLATTVTVTDITTDFAFSLQTDSEYTVRAAKLELGDTQTLARQGSDGGWMLNEIPDYGRELQKCKRYLRINYMVNAVHTGNSNYYSLANTLSPEMRTTPTVVIKGFHPFGNTSIFTFTDTDRLKFNGKYLDWAFLPGCAGHDAGGLVLDLSAEL